VSFRNGQATTLSFPVPHLLSATHTGPTPAFRGGPDGVKAPVVESTEKVVTLSEPRFAT